MTINKNSYIQEAQKAGLSTKASSVYVVLLNAGQSLAPIQIVNQSGLHRQYVYDGLEELKILNLIISEGKGRGIKYKATTPERLAQESEKRHLEAGSGVQALMKLYDQSPAGAVEVIRGKHAVIDHTLKQINDAKPNTWVDIIGGAGMTFVELYRGKMGEYEQIRKSKNIKLRYIGDTRSVVYNKTTATISNESKMIEGIDDGVNVLIMPDQVSFNIYEPEIMTVTIKSAAAAQSQRKLFEVLWKNAKKY